MCQCERLAWYNGVMAGTGATPDTRESTLTERLIAAARGLQLLPRWLRAGGLSRTAG